MRIAIVLIMLMTGRVQAGLAMRGMAAVRANMWEYLQLTDDLSTNNNDGTIFGGVSTNATSPFDGQASAEFNGTTSYMALDSSKSLSRGRTQITLEVYIKSESLSDYNNILFESTSSLGTKAQYSLFTASDGTLWFGGRSGGDGSFITFSKSASSAIVTGVWQHIAATFDGTSKEYLLFIDGEEIESTKYTGSVIFPDTDPLASFVASGLDINYFDGEMSEMRWWDYVRTATQISDNYNKRLTGSETGLIGYWPLTDRIKR